MNNEDLDKIRGKRFSCIDTPCTRAMQGFDCRGELREITTYDNLGEPNYKTIWCEAMIDFTRRRWIVQ